VSPSVIFHVDLDAFFASVELIDDPSLAGKPVIVGALPGNRGVVSTCSYEARAFGVRSAMPISEAYRRCPDGVFLRPRMDRYVELSNKVMDVFASFTPEVERLSIDEAFLDMTGTERLWGEPDGAARLLKSKVREETALGISVGIAPNRYAAKIASALRKPDGLVRVEADGLEAFMLGLPLTKLWGAGEKTQERFKELGIGCTAQLANLGEAQLKSLFGAAGGAFLYGAVRGRDVGGFGFGEGAARTRGSRSISAETTFERDSSDRGQAEDVLLALANELAYRLWDEGASSSCLGLKLRLHDFSTISRRLTRRSRYRSSAEIFKDALALLDKAWDGGTAIRLLGLRLAELEDEGADAQGELFPEPSSRAIKAESAVFEIERKGIGKVTKARLLDRGERGHSERGAGSGRGGR
jgi:DNA polymerase IV